MTSRDPGGDPPASALADARLSDSPDDSAGSGGAAPAPGDGEPGPAAPPSQGRTPPHGLTKRAGRVSRLMTETHAEDKIHQLLEQEEQRIEAVYQFNASPTRNIGRLCEFFGRAATPADVAHVLHSTQGLLGAKIGEFLARPEHEAFLRAYFDAVDLRTNFLEAMRRGLSGPFFMPGEAQQVERTIQALAEAYMAQNPGVFGHVNDPVVLGFALVMLNTDMLKPNVTRKMTAQEFVANTSGAFEHSQFPREQLELMYASLRESPFAFAPKSNDFMALCAPKKRGWLAKKSARFGAAWKPHYFVLTMSSLYYFKDESPESKDRPLGSIQLVEVDIAADARAPRRFVVTAHGDQIQYVKLSGVPRLVPGVRSILFEAKSEESAAEWLFRLKRAACMGSFLDGGGLPCGGFD
jgi:hypothetical protein